MSTSTRSFTVRLCSAKVSDVLEIEWGDDLGKRLMKDLKLKVGKLTWPERLAALRPAVKTADAEVLKKALKTLSGWHPDGLTLLLLIADQKRAGFPPPGLTRLDLDVEVTYPGDTLPPAFSGKKSADGGKGALFLGMRLLALSTPASALAKAYPSLATMKPKYPPPFKAAGLLSHTTPTKGFMQILMPSDLVPALKVGKKLESTAW